MRFRARMGNRRRPAGTGEPGRPYRLAAAVGSAATAEAHAHQAESG
jgi:hypothetical protein